MKTSAKRWVAALGFDHHHFSPFERMRRSVRGQVASEQQVVVGVSGELSRDTTEHAGQLTELLCTIVDLMDGCPLACRPLRQRAPIAQGLALAVGEGLLFAIYAREGAEAEWAAHVLLAATLWAVVNLAYLTLKGAPARGHVVSLLGWHFVAMVVDLLVDAWWIGQGSWLNVLLEDDPEHGLVTSLGGLLATALVASELYGSVLAGCIFARRAEVAAGMAPGIGLGGSHLLRPQRPIGRAQLGHHRFGPLKPPDVVLLHGLRRRTRLGGRSPSGSLIEVFRSLCQTSLVSAAHGR